jgi:hypothetical protein
MKRRGIREQLAVEAKVAAINSIAEQTAQLSHEQLVVELAKMLGYPQPVVETWLASGALEARVTTPPALRAAATRFVQFHGPRDGLRLAARAPLPVQLPEQTPKHVRDALRRRWLNALVQAAARAGEG